MFYLFILHSLYIDNTFLFIKYLVVFRKSPNSQRTTLSNRKSSKERGYALKSRKVQSRTSQITINTISSNERVKLVPTAIIKIH